MRRRDNPTLPRSRSALGSLDVGVEDGLVSVEVEVGVEDGLVSVEVEVGVVSVEG